MVSLINCLKFSSGNSLNAGKALEFFKEFQRVLILIIYLAPCRSPLVHHYLTWNEASRFFVSKQLKRIGINHLKSMWGVNEVNVGNNKLILLKANQ